MDDNSLPFDNFPQGCSATLDSYCSFDKFQKNLGSSFDLNFISMKNYPKILFAQLLVALLFGCCSLQAADTIVYQGKSGPGLGKHLVFISGDEEYRSEESFPMLAKILSQRHGFKCTVLFALDTNGVINPNTNNALPGADALDSADCVITLLRWRNYPEAQMKHFVDAYKRGVPFVALRTSTHAFKSNARTYDKFGKKVFGEDWVSHWGNHKKEATRGIIEPSAKDQPILRGVTDLFGTSDVYEAYPPADATILVRGQVLKGMNPTDEPADRRKNRSTDKQEQAVNDPMMAIAWTRLYKNEAGNTNRIFCTTMGAATDLTNESLRRLVVNGVYWGLNMEVPMSADVKYVDPYNPSMYGFDGFKKGIKPEDHALGKMEGAEAK
ncbi:MAG: hypothetical protein JWN25_139 [Verrucomicrobiales bacterium]|nr:hypothetical protein [Verrucomicrobiales bacterium]